MAISAILLFALTEFFLSLSPGPAVFLVISQGIRSGFKASLAGALGILTGNAIYFALSALGVGAILLTSQTLFLAIKWTGAAYLIFLGLQLIYSSFRRKGTVDTPKLELKQGKLFRQGLLMQLANPQAILFFVAILPQFIDIQAAPAPQLFILGFISIFVEFPILLAYGWLAEKGGALLKQSRFVKWLDRVAGTFLVGAGIKLAFSEQS